METCQRDGRGSALNYFLLRFRCWTFTKRGGLGETGFGGSIPSAAALLVYACVEKASVLNYCFLLLRISVFLDRGAVILVDL